MTLFALVGPVVGGAVAFSRSKGRPWWWFLIAYVLGVVSGGVITLVAAYAFIVYFPESIGVLGVLYYGGICSLVFPAIGVVVGALIAYKRT
ncbi:MAG: hypothetical protein GEU91_16660 [Rhizobiales bacterium]|nr:hypothetical protein [Hyphomicrobiales bacterium]